jgi:hypothetical protein
MTSEQRKQSRYARRKAERDRKKQEKIALYDNFSPILDPDNLYQSFKKSRRNVAWKESVQRYEMNWLHNIAETSHKLARGESVQSDFVEFDVRERGRTRHIKSVHISERVVQKCLCDKVLIPILSRALIYDNGASRMCKGVYFALRRLIAHLSKFYRQNGRSNNGYALTIDFSKYFDSIRHDILLAMQSKVIQDTRILDIARRFVTVFGDGVSLGLGSQVSQISAIFYLNRLDHIIKEKLRIKFYGCYMDDLYLLHADKSYLKNCLNEIQKVCDELGITINLKKTKIVSLSDGLEFLKGKYVIGATGKIIKRPCGESVKRTRRKLKKFKHLIERGRMDYHDVKVSYQSWRGNFLKRFFAYHTVERMDVIYNDLFVRDFKARNAPKKSIL